MSGSGQFSEFNLHHLQDRINELANEKIDDIIIFDLRLESHGFVNGLPIHGKFAKVKTILD